RYESTKRQSASRSRSQEGSVKCNARLNRSERSDTCRCRRPLVSSLIPSDCAPLRQFLREVLLDKLPVGGLLPLPSRGDQAQLLSSIVMDNSTHRIIRCLAQLDHFCGIGDNTCQQLQGLPVLGITLERT